MSLAFILKLVVLVLGISLGVIPESTEPPTLPKRSDSWETIPFDFNCDWYSAGESPGVSSEVNETGRVAVLDGDGERLCRRSSSDVSQTHGVSP